MDKEIVRIINAAEALINRLHNEAIFNPNITECNELYLALFSIGRCIESASQPPVEADAESHCKLCGRNLIDGTWE